MLIQLDTVLSAKGSNLHLVHIRVAPLTSMKLGWLTLTAPSLSLNGPGSLHGVCGLLLHCKTFYLPDCQMESSPDQASRP